MTACPVISEKNFQREVFENPPCPGEYRSLASLNIRIDKDVSPFHLTEDLLEERLQELENLRSDSSAAYWLTLARLTELALFCGGTYADAGEFSAAGDLLVNPRLVQVHLRGRRQVVTKERHVPLSEQFRDVADTSRGVIQWLKHNTIVRVVKGPLLCSLNETLKCSGRFRRTYLESIDDRMKRIADTLSFLAAENMRPRRGPCSHRRRACLSEKAFFKSKLCRFELEHFLQLGCECWRVLKAETMVSHYLKPVGGRLNTPVPNAKYEDREGLAI